MNSPEQTPESRPARDRRVGTFTFGAVLVICGAIVAALTLFFRVNTVVVSGQQRYTQQQILDASGIQTGDNLFLLNKYDVANQIIGELQELLNREKLERLRRAQEGDYRVV